MSRRGTDPAPGPVRREGAGRAETVGPPSSRLTVETVLFPARFWPAADAAQEAPTAPVPSGFYELEASMGGEAFPVRLELLSLEDRPWGRLTIVAGQERVVAVRGTGVTEGAWDFAVGGPVRRLRLRFADGSDRYGHADIFRVEAGTAGLPSAP